MMKDVPKADVVIVNPTHIAIAIKYDPSIAPAPIVLALGPATAGGSDETAAGSGEDQRDEDDLATTIESLHADGETLHIPVIVMAPPSRIAQHRDEVMLADYVVARGDFARLSQALQRLVGRQAVRAGAGQLRPRVLVVDDEPEVVDFTRFVLEREGFEVRYSEFNGIHTVPQAIASEAVRWFLER